MIHADITHKETVINILSACFENNKTVNWIVKQDDRKKERIRYLLEYSFDTCVDSGFVLLTDDSTGAIICQLSDDKLPILHEAYLTLQFVLKVTGIEGIAKTLRRERYIKQFHPADCEFIYIWFIGVVSSEQGKGVGSKLIHELIVKSNNEQLPIYLETSSNRNIVFYKRHGFEEYHVTPEEMFGYTLYFLRRLPNAAGEKAEATANSNF